MKAGIAFCIVLLLGFKHVSAQTYMATYGRYTDLKDSIKKTFPSVLSLDRYCYSLRSDWYYKTIFNDSLSFCDAMDYGGDDILKHFEKLMLKKKLPYAFFSYCDKNKLYNISYSPKRKEQIFILDSVTEPHWIVDSSYTQYNLFDRKCNLAYCLTGWDTVFILYTKELPGRFGPSVFRNAPGFILAVFQQKGNVSFIATKLEKIDFKLTVPADKLVLTREVYARRKNE